MMDALRGYAILAVVLVHTENYLNIEQGLLKSLCHQGARGVQLFFMVSAMTLWASTGRRMRRDDHWIRDFAVRRFFRIAPLFYLGIVFYTWLYGFAPRYWAPDGVTLNTVILTTAFLHGWHPESITSVVPGGWSIAVEMTFYSLVPFLLLLVANKRAALILLVVSLGIRWAANLWLAPILIPEYPLEKEWLGIAFKQLWFFSQAPIFAAGIFAYYLLGLNPSKPKAWWRPTALLVLAVIGIVYVVSAPQWWAITPPDLVFTGVFLAGITALHWGAHRWACPRAIQWLGQISYSVYLVHFAVIHVWRVFYPEGIGSGNIVGLLWGMSAIMIPTMIIAYALWHWVEKPGIALGNRIIFRYAK